jgi:alpha-glucuronidase
MAHNPECGLDCVSAGAVRGQSADADQSAGRRDLAGDQSAEQAIPFGPWIVGFGGHSGGYWTWAVETQAEPMAVRVENAPDRATAIAVAKFAAAAPEMYEALKLAEDQLVLDLEDIGYDEDDMREHATLQVMRNAIAKAEGRDR